MGEYWQHDLERMHEGMLLLGWRADSRLTSEDEAMTTPLVDRAISLNDSGDLTPEEIDGLALEVYKIASFQIMNTVQRARLISSSGDIVLNSLAVCHRGAVSL